MQLLLLEHISRMQCCKFLIKLWVYACKFGNCWLWTSKTTLIPGGKFGAVCSNSVTLVGTWDNISVVPVLYQSYGLCLPENSLGQLVCRVFFSCGEFSHCDHPKKTQCEICKGFFRGKNYISGHIMRTVLVDDRQVHLPDQKEKKTPIAVTVLRKKKKSTEY